MPPSAPLIFAIDIAEVAGIGIAIAAAIPTLITVVRRLLIGRAVQRGRSITIEIDGDRLTLVDASPEEQARLFEYWLAQSAPVVERNDGEHTG